MKIIDLIKTFFTAKPFLHMEIHVVFHTGDRVNRIFKTHSGIEYVKTIYGNEIADKVEFNETGLTFYVSENDESW